MAKRAHRSSQTGSLQKRRGDRARGWLQPLARAWTQWRGATAATPVPMVEEYEQRLMYSADLAAVGLALTPGVSAAPAVEQRLLDTEGEYAAADATARSRQTELVIVDAAIDDKNILLNQIHTIDGRRIDILTLEAGDDGVRQISEALRGRSDIVALHILSHGADGALQLGNTTLDSALLAARGDEIRGWANALSDSADLMLYGCDVASSAQGMAFVRQLGELTGTDASASSNRTGHVLAHGDWTLEFTTGEINTSALLTAQGQAAWLGTLATFSVTNADNNGNGSLRKAIEDANATPGADIIEFNIAGSGPQIVNVISGLTITDQITIDGTRNNGAIVNGGLPGIILDGSGVSADGLTLADGADGSTITGLVIRDFKGDGIEIEAGADNNTIAGNFIGNFNANGTQSSSGDVNTGAGIHVNSRFNVIGGATTAERNVIGGNQGPGILVENPAGLSTLGFNNRIEGNVIGTEADGTTALANSIGIQLNNGAQWDFIVNNIISRNTGSGILIGDAGASVHDLLIGGSAAGGNTITANGGDGVTVVSGIHNSILSNRISGNTGLGIDLRNSAAAVGVTGNDINDADGGGNELQNFPLLTAALVESPTQIRILGKLNSVANTLHVVEFFSNTTADASGHGEGQTYLGNATLSTDAAGNAEINVLLSATVPAGSVISATATNFYTVVFFPVRGSTSEFSANVVAAVNVAPVNTLPAAQAVNEDTSIAINGISVNDTNANLASTRLTVANGTLNVTLSGGASIVAGSNGSADLTLGGTQAAINATLATLTYRGALNYSGADTLQVVSRDTASTPLSDTDTLAIAVNPINDAPASPGGTVTGAEDTALVLSWADFGVTDVDTAISATTAVRLDVLPASGTLEYSSGGVWTRVALGQVFTKATIDAGSLRFVPLADESGYDGYAATGVGNLRQDYAQFTFTPLQSTAITVLNPSGEANGLANGAFQNPAIGWVTSGADAGAQNPTAAMFTPDRSAMLYVNAGATLTQTLAATFTAARNYSLSFEFGWRGDPGYPTEPNFQVQLWAGSTLMGSFDQNSLVGVRGEFVAGVLNMAGNLSGAVEGSALQIRLVGTALQSNFINVALTSFARASDIGAPAQMTINIAPVNDAPVAALVTLPEIAEDSGVNLITPAQLLAGVTDVDGPAASITSLSLASGAGVLVNNGDGTWNFTPALNDDTAVSFSYTASDGSLTASSTATLNIKGVNDAPLATPVTLAAIAEDSGARLITSAQLLTGVTDADGPAATLVSLSIANGGGVLVDNGNGTWNYTPAFNDSSAVTFSYSASDGEFTASSSASLDITPVNDAPVVDLNGAGAGTGATLAFVENGVAVAIAPAAAVSDIDSTDFNGGDLIVGFSANGTVDDQLAIFNQGSGAGQMGVSGANISFGGVVIGTFAGGTNGSNLVITFNSATATPTAVQALIRNIQYTNTSESPSTLARSVTYTLNDGDGGAATAAATASITVTAANDTPAVDLNGAAAGTSVTRAYTENGASIAIAPAATATDLDSADFNGGSLTVSFTANGTTADQLTIQNQGVAAGQIGVSGANVTYGGTVIGTFTGGANGSNLVVSFNSAAATPTATQALIQRIRFANNSDNPSGLARTLTYTLNDGDGGASNSTTTATINVTAVNDPPAVDLNGAAAGTSANVAYTENGLATAIAPGATVNDADSADFGAGSLTVTFTANGTTADQLVIENQGVSAGQIGVSGANVTFGGVTIGTVAGGVNGAALVVSFNSAATPGAAQALIQHIQFANNSDNPSTLARTLTYTLNDGDGGTGPVATATINVTAVNDAPTASNLAVGEVYVENAALDLIDIVISDADSPNVTATLTLSVPAAGSLSTATAGAVTSVYDAFTGTWTASGAIGDVNTLLAGLTFNPALNFNGAFSIASSISDGAAAPVTGVKALSGVASNIAPTAINNNAAETYGEDTALDLVDMIISDTDSPNVTVTLTLSDVAAGSLSTATSGLVTATFDAGTGVWIASGAIADVNALLAGVLFNPAANYNAAFSIATTFTDGVSAAVSGSKPVTGVAIDDAPVSLPVVLAGIAEDSGPRLITQAELLASATDVDSPSLVATALAVSAGAGTLVDNGNGTWSYTPALNDDTAVTFSYTVTDGVLNTAGSASLDIQPVNDAPLTAPVTLAAIAEDSGATLITQAALLVNVNDVDSGALVASGLAISVGGGSLADNGDGTWSYTAASDDDTAVSFSYTVSDGTLAAAGTASLDLLPVNDAPLTTVVNLAAIAEDSGARLVTQAELLAGTTDIDSVGLTALSLTLSSGAGSLVDNGNGTWFYTPASNDDTSVTFGYTVTDGSSSASASASLDILPVNDAPQTALVTLSAVPEDGGIRLITQAELLANASDPDGPALTATGLAIVSGAGTLIDNGNGTWGYLAAADDDASVTFSYTVTDGLRTAAGSATLDITPVNDAPVATPVTLGAIAEDSGALLIRQQDMLVNASDVDTPSLTAANLVIAAGAGTLVDNNDGTWRYTPNLNDDGSVVFGFNVTDGSLSTAGSASLDLAPVNDAPVITVPGPQSITQNTAVALAGISVADPEGNGVFAALSVGNGALTVSLSGGASVTGNGSANLGISGSQADINATLASLTYQGNSGFTGADVLSVLARDSDNATDTRTLNLVITASNQVPVIGGIAAGAVSEDDASPVLAVGAALSITDPDSGESQFVAQTGTSGTYGTFSVDAAGNWIYVAANNQPAIQQLAAGATVSDSFTVFSVDGSASQNVLVTITGVNDTAVIAGAVTGNLTEEAAATLLASGVLTISDADSGQAAFAAQTNVAGAYGIFDIDSAGNWSYAAFNNNPLIQQLNTGSTVSERFVVASADGSAIERIVIVINGVDDIQVLANSGATLNEGGHSILTTAQLQAGSAGAAAASFTYTLVGAPAAGSLVLGTQTLTAGGQFTQADIDNGRLRYTHDGSETAADAFVFTVADASSATAAPASFVLTIHPVNDAPVAANQSVATLDNTSVVIRPGDLGYVDAEGVSLARIRITALPSEGVLSLGNTPVSVNQEITAADLSAGNLQFVPRAGLSAQTAATIGFQVSDGSAYSASNNFSVLITPATLPTANPVTPSQPAVAVTTDPVTVAATPAVQAATTPATVAVAAPAVAGAAPAADPLSPSPTVILDATGVQRGAPGVSELADIIVARSPGLGQMTSPGAITAFMLNSMLAQFNLEALKPLEASVGDRLASATSSAAFIGELDRVRDGVRADEVLERNIIVSSVATGATMSVGYVLWLLRGGLLMTSLLSSLPAWRFVDPLPVMARLKGDDEEEDEGADDTVESIVRGARST